MDAKIIHVDMDAFYAAVEVRDNPELRGKPLIIGALPHERGVVSTCSYEARKFGVRSAMSIKDAYRLCPQGIFMHPNMHKYHEASDRIHEIWLTYTNLAEFISLDEGFLDVTGAQVQVCGDSGGDSGGGNANSNGNGSAIEPSGDHGAAAENDAFAVARQIGLEIKRRTIDETGLTCSVGIGYSMTAAKLASEEKKPNGFFEIPNAKALKELIIDRGVRIIYGVGPKTAEALQRAGINTVRDILENQQAVITLFGSNGRHIVNLAEGKDDRRVTPYYEGEAKSISRETTFQHDVMDFDYLKDALRLLAKELSLKIRLDGAFVRTVTLKVKYGNMKLITRSKSGNAICRAKDIYETAAALLDTVEKRPIRLIGIGLSNFEENNFRQMTLDDLDTRRNSPKKEALDRTLLELQRRYGGEVIKTGNEIIAEKRFKYED